MRALAGCGKSPPAAFSHHSDAQRTAESTIRLFALAAALLDGLLRILRAILTPRRQVS
ncbi:MAG: hypothetical protein OJF52_000782 [Nitrospira sp.]|nr:MAG: hypothetical protein OJF52_000782 [Nitrospira sp.]